MKMESRNRSMLPFWQGLMLLAVLVTLPGSALYAAEVAAPATAAPKSAPTKSAPTKPAPTKAAPTKAAPTKAAPTLAPSVPAPAAEFKGFEQVQAKAAALAAKPFTENTPELPPFLSDLDYDQYRDIRFRPDQSLWRQDHLPFQVQYFSRGSIFRNRVLINVIEQGKQLPIEFAPSMFDFGRLPVPMEVPNDLGFAGFRLHYQLNVQQYFDEVIAFLGASYFRAVGRDELYGLSARGLAVDTGLPKGEEFPVFREFWLEKPAKGAREITVYALLDSPSVAGAYRFVIRPGEETNIAVTAHLNFRSNIQKLGIAPLTSMFFRGKTTQRYVDDFRPEIHDSDGLLIEAGNGELIWRPLNNPQRLAFSSFRINQPRGFGLFQRERDFTRYQDLEAKYQRRPSAWVTPVGNWGPGSIDLVEIPANSEFDDNIVAFWVPEQPVTAGSKRTFEYTLSFGKDLQRDALVGHAVSMGIGHGKHHDASQRRFVVDFAGGELARLPDTTVVTADVFTSTGALGIPVVERNPYTGGYRVFFELTPGDEPLAELRLNLRSGENVISEVWTYQWLKEKY
jgi:periplasmic glucans biosynthesis protein